MVSTFDAHLTRLRTILQNESELDDGDKGLLFRFVTSLLHNATASLPSFPVDEVIFFSYEEIVECNFGKREITILSLINITLHKTSNTNNYVAKVIYPLGYTIPTARTRSSKPFTLDILPILQACNRFSKKAKKNTELYILAKKLKDMAKDAKKAAKEQHVSGKFVFTQTIPTLLVSTLSDRTTKTLLSKGVSFEQIDENNTKVTMTFVDKS